MFFPEDMVTDHPERFIVSEIIREKVLNYLEEEVPHGVAIEIESYKEEPNITRIGAVIYCEKKISQGYYHRQAGQKAEGHRQGGTPGDRSAAWYEGLLGIMGQS